MKSLYFLLLFIMMSTVALSQSDKEVLPMEIVKYYFVELITNENGPELSKTEVDSIQAAHMANIGKMINNKKLVLAGPFENGGGIFILKVNSLEEATALTQEDPAVKSGRLLTEIRPWYTTKGVFRLEE